MLDNEPTNGTEGTEGTTETTDHEASAPPTGEDGVRLVRTPAPAKGARRAAGPPPEPDEIFSPAPTEPVTSIAGSGTGGTVKTEVSTPAARKRTVRAAGSPAAPPPPAETAGTGASVGPATDEETEAAEDGPRSRGRRARTRTVADTGSEATTQHGRRQQTKKAERAAEAETGAEQNPRRSGKSKQRAEPAEAQQLQEPDEQSPGEASQQPGTLFQPPSTLFRPPMAETASAKTPDTARSGDDGSHDSDDGDTEPSATEEHGDKSEERTLRRRRRRGGRGRGRSRAAESENTQDTSGGEPVRSERGGSEADRGGAEDKTGSGPDRSAKDDGDDESEESSSSRRRRRRRRRSGAGAGEAGTEDDPPNTVVKVREPRPEKPIEDEVQAVRGSTRLEAKKQRRREGREQGRRRAPIVTESEFLARRESVKRDLVIRRTGERTQIAVLEDDVLVEHHVDRATHRSYVGNVYLGRVQNVLPSMEAAFVDIGKGRNAVLYAGEVNWDVLGVEGQPKRIESVLKSGQSVLVQVTKDPMGHKGARLTSQISLPGRYLVYVPGGSMTGISRKLPDKERARLKQILKKVMPADAGVIVRTAAEGASEEELERDITRLAKQWESIQRKSKSNTAPALLNSEPDLTIRVVRDVFNEDFSSLVVSGDEAWETVHEYVDYVAPNLAERLSHWTEDRDVFAAYRIDEQINKALERKVWLPSGGSLIIDRTEAMTVVDVNTGKFTGQGGNLEETVTKNNLEAAEEIVRQLRLRDIGGIIVIDFIDMVLESNRDLVLRRMLECLSRDRTKHQVAEVTSLGLVQMTRKRVGQGLLDAFSHTCEHCSGRGLLITEEPAESKNGNGNGNGGGRKKKGKGKSESEAADDQGAKADKNEKAEQSGKADKAGKAGKNEKAEKGSKADKSGKAGQGAETAEAGDKTEEAPSGKKSKSRAKTAKGGKKSDKAAGAAEEAQGGSATGQSDSGADEPGDKAEKAPAKRTRKRSTRTKEGAQDDRSAGAEQVTEESAGENSAPSAENPAPSEGDDEASERPRRRRTRRTRTAASAGTPADAG